MSKFNSVVTSLTNVERSTVEALTEIIGGEHSDAHKLQLVQQRLYRHEKECRVVFLDDAVNPSNINGRDFGKSLQFP